MAPGWDINIVGHDVQPASWFLANEKNVKIHPRAQSEATEGSLNELGWVKSVTVNIRTSARWGPQDRNVRTVVDGHDRIKLALRRGDETPVPIEYVDLTPEKEDIFLAVVDAITALGLRDKEKLDSLLRETKPADAALQQFLSELAAKEGLYQGNSGQSVTAPEEFPEYGEDIDTQYRCPRCQYSWSGQPK